MKGVSAWNFDLAALKAQAALEPDDGSVPPTPTFHPSMPTILEGPEDSGRLDAGVPSSEVCNWVCDLGPIVRGSWCVWFLGW